MCTDVMHYAYNAVHVLNKSWYQVNKVYGLARLPFIWFIEKFCLIDCSSFHAHLNSAEVTSFSESASPIQFQKRCFLHTCNSKPTQFSFSSWQFSVTTAHIIKPATHNNSFQKGGNCQCVLLNKTWSYHTQLSTKYSLCFTKNTAGIKPEHFWAKSRYKKQLFFKKSVKVL